MLTGGLQDFRLDAHLLGESLTALELLHESTANIVLAMPLNLAGGFAVKDKTDRVLQTNKSKRGVSVKRKPKSHERNNRTLPFSQIRPVT